MSEGIGHFLVIQLPHIPEAPHILIAPNAPEFKPRVRSSDGVWNPPVFFKDGIAECFRGGDVVNFDVRVSCSTTEKLS